MAKSLKEQTASAIFWNFMDKGGQQVLQFVFLYILARLLTSDDWGLIALLAIFTAIANILQESGFSSALVRKADADNSDCSSVFYFNIGISLIVYLILFIAAPLIAGFYEKPILKDLSRFLFLSFIFNAFCIVQNVQLIKKMDFKTNAQITFVAVILSGCIAILFAYKGFGVWSLAIQQVAQAFFRMILLWVVVKWIPETSFRPERLKDMYGYSFKLLLNSLFNQISNNLMAIVIGKKYLISDAGNYWQANKLGNLSQTIIASGLSGVIFPLLSNLNGMPERITRIYRKIVRVVSFLCFPLAVFTIVAADSIVLIVLGDKWVDVIPMLRLLAIGSSVLPLLYSQTALLQSLGKSGLLLSMELVRNVVTILTILIISKYGIHEMILSISIIFILTFFIEYYIVGKCINYSIIEVLKDIFPYIFMSVISFVPFYFLNELTQNKWILIILQFAGGGIIYLTLLKIAGSKVIEDLIRVVRRQPLD